MTSIIKLSIVFALLFASLVQSAPSTKAHIKGDATEKIASLDKPCGGPKDRQCAKGLYCVKLRDCPTEPCKKSYVTHFCKKSPDPNGQDTNAKFKNGTKTNGNNTDSKPVAKGSKGNCKIAVIADQSFANSHGKDAEQSIKDIVKGTSDIINAEFGITISIESLDIKNGLSRRASKGPERERVNDYFEGEIKKIPNRENLCFVLGLTSTVVPGVGGWSPVGAACKETKIIVRNEGTKPDSITRGVKTFTHEIGHMLGAEHDEDTSCKGNEEVMGRSGQDHGETVQFSQCSKDAITPKLGGYQCLYN